MLTKYVELLSRLTSLLQSVMESSEIATGVTKCYMMLITAVPKKNECVWTKIFSFVAILRKRRIKERNVNDLKS